MTRPSRSHRLRTVLFAAVLGFSTFAVEAAPTSIPLPRPEALTPEPALALGCADSPTFTGRVTASSGSTVAITRSTTGNVAGYISNVIDDWSCTAYFRYDGLAWARNSTGTLGNFDWGNLINSTSVSCNWVIGSTDYLKGNATTDCPDSDAEYSLPIHFDDTSSANLLQAVAHADYTPDQIGDFAFIHSDCTSYYGGESVRNNYDFASGTVNNRPGANCDPTLLDSTNTTQSIVIDNVKPAPTFTAPAGAAGTVTGFNTAGNPYQVKFTVTDAIAGFDASHTWKLQRLIGTAVSGVCSGMANDPAAGSVVTGTVQTLQTNNQTLAVPACYRWQLSATDANGNVATTLTSADVITDVTVPNVSFTNPAGGATVSRNTTAFSVSWTDGDTGSGIATRSLQRQRVAATSSACPGTFTNDGSAVTTASPSSQTLTSGYCYQWIQTITDRAGLQAVATSSKVYIDTTIPMGDYSTPNEGTTTVQLSTSSTRSWTETAGSGTITARSTQRQKGTVLNPGTCADVTWADDGSPSTLGSAVVTSGLLTNRCYRWVLTLTNSAGKIGVTTSGAVLIDATAPAGTIAFPETNRPLAGDVVVTGTATDQSSFQNYQLEYGVGVSPASWTSIGTVTSQVTTTGPLITWPTGSLNGVYTLRLTVRDTVGNTASVTSRVVYLENAKRGDEASFTRVPFDLGGDYTLDVGVANGEARLSRDLFSIPSYGPPQALSLTYSSLETGTAGKFGVGWSSNLTQYLTFESGFTVWHRADGGRVPFGQVASVWTPLRGHFETMAVSGGEVSITTKDQTTYVFEDTGAGRLKRITNRFGKSLTMVWNTTTATATDASGRVTSIAIDSTNGRITGVTDSAGRVWAFGYTGTTTNSDLTSITDPASKVTTIAYASHALTTVTRSRSRVSGGPESLVWTVGYTSGKATAVSDPELSTPSTFVYAGGLTTFNQVVDESVPAYASTIYGIDTLGRVVSETDPEGDGTTLGFDLDSNLESVVTLDDDLGPATLTMSYDARGNVLVQTDPIDAGIDVVTVNTYSATNDLLTRTDADNDSAVRTVTKYTYDGAGHLTSLNLNCTSSGTTVPGAGLGGTCTGAGTQDASTNVITNYAYTSNDQLAYEQDPLGRVTKHNYDTYGNETSTVANCTTSGTSAPSPFSSCTAGGTHDAQTNVATSATFDQATTAGKAGLFTKTTDALGRDTTYTYDALGRQLTEVAPGDASVPVLTRTTSWDELGNPLTETDGWTPLAGGGATSRQTTHVYDKTNRETVLTDPASTSTTTTFDPAGRAVQVDTQGPGGTGLVSKFQQFDLRGRLMEERLGSVNEAPTTFDYTRLGARRQVVTPADITATAEVTFTGLPTTVVTTEPLEGPETTTVDHVYDRLGRETSTTNEVGVVTTTTYDRLGRLLTTTIGGSTTTHAYDRNGNEVSLTLPHGMVTSTTYDPLDRPTTIVANDVASPTLPTQDVTTTTYYDASGSVVATKDPTGISTRSILNVRGQASQTLSNCTDSGATPTTAPASCVGAGTHDDVTNLVTNLTYDGAGAAINSVTAVGRPAEATTETAFDAAGRVVAVKDPRGTISRAFFNTAGQLTKTVINCTTTGTTIPTDWVNCTGAGTNDGTFNMTTAFAYDAHGNQVSVTGPNGRVTSSSYDEADRLAKVIDNDVASPTLPTDDLTTEYSYDGLGRQAAIKAPTTNGSTFAVTRIIYNDDGTVAQQIANCVDSPPAASPELCVGNDPTVAADKNIVTTYTYDSHGNRIRMTAPDPSATTGTSTATVTTQYAFDAADRLCRVVENATGSTNLQTLSDPCSTATQTSGTAATNVSTRYGFDPPGNLTSMIDAAGHTTSYAYDAAGRMASRTDALSEVLVWKYDALGHPIRQENRSDPPLTPSVTWTYDGGGRILTRVADSVTTSYTYDANGNKLTATTGSLAITSTYDRLNRPLTVDDEDAGTTADTTYTYSLTSPTWTDPTGTYGVTLDKFDRATVINDPVNATNFTTTYRADGQRATFAQPNGNTTDYTYDATGHLTGSDADTAGGTDRAVYGWTYNRAGQVLTEASTITGDPSNGTVTYGYDPLGRLTGSTLSSVTTAYGWDAVPNRTSVQVGADPAITTAYNNADRPTSDSAGGSYASDDDGRLLTRPGQQLTWDHLGRLTQVKDGGGTTLATYSYDPLDRLRTVDYGGSNRIRFRYVGLTTAAAQWLDDVAGTVTRSIGTGWTGERLLDWTGSGSNIRIYGENAHHDVTWLADNTGTVSQALRYDPWGTPRATVPTGYSPFRFQGSWYDDTTSLSWVVTRWYAPALGRFVSEDSLLGEPIDPPSRHLYAYGAGEPVGRWDPNGRECRPTYVYYLNCSVKEFDRMSALQRRDWLRAFQTRYSPTWFNAIEGVLEGIHRKGAMRPGVGWFSLVDAYILAAVQDGQRLHLRKPALVPSNPANVLWKQFFDERALGASDRRLRYLWGRAEQTATDFGTMHSAFRTPTLQENGVKSITDLWRFAVANGDGIFTYADTIYCQMLALCRPIPVLYHFVRDTVVDPRAKVTVVALFGIVWDALGAVSCALAQPIRWWGNQRLC